MDNSDEDKQTRRKVRQLQNVPRKLRDSIVPEDGNIFIGADWAAIEWALVQYFAAEINIPEGFHEDLLDRFQAGELDPHRHLASVANGKPEHDVSDAERTQCKPYTHGRNFKGTPRGLAREVGHKDSVGIKVCEAHSRAFKPESWWEDRIAAVASRHYVQTPLGWRRWFWEYSPKITEVLATEIQGTAADLMKWVLVRMFKETPEFRGWTMTTTTHDSMLLEVPIMDTDWATKWVREQMEQPIPWLRGRTWRADVKVGDSWRAVS